MYTLIDPVCAYFTGSHLFLYSCNIIIIKRDRLIIDKVCRYQKDINTCIYDLLSYIEPVFGGIRLTGNKSGLVYRTHLKSICNNYAFEAHIVSKYVRDHLI